VQIASRVYAPQTFAGKLLVDSAFGVLIEELISELHRTVVDPTVRLVSAEVCGAIVVEVNFLGKGGDTSVAAK
jgi:hypothetical protein